MIGDNRAIWCGTEIFKDPDLGGIWSRYDRRWFALQGPDPRLHAWSMSTHRWILSHNPPAHLRDMQFEEELQGGAALADPPGQHGQPHREVEHEVVD